MISKETLKQFEKIPIIIKFEDIDAFFDIGDDEMIIYKGVVYNIEDVVII